MKVYKRTEESKRNLSESRKGEGNPMYGRTHSPETRKKMSESQRGEKNPMYGKKFSEETRAKMSESHKGERNYLYGKHLSKETLEKLSKSHTGRIPSEETRKKMSESHKGKTVGDNNGMYGRTGNRNPFFGKTHSEETKRKMRESKKGKYIGEKSSRFGKHPTDLTRYRMSIAKKGVFCGNRNPSWKGGISFEPYCPKFNKEFKIRVRSFFDNKCVLCGKTKEDNGGINLSVHHINYDKMVCCNDTKPIFAALCRSCHVKTNNNREYWQKILEEKVNENYNGKSFYTKHEYTSMIGRIRIIDTEES